MATCACATTDGDILTVQSEAAGGDLRVRHDQTVTAGTPVVIAVRPEKVRVGDPARIDGDNRLCGRVEEIGYLGDVSIYHVRIPSGGLVEAQLTNRQRRAASPLTWGDEACLAWNTDDAVALLE